MKKEDKIKKEDAKLANALQELRSITGNGELKKTLRGAIIGNNHSSLSPSASASPSYPLNYVRRFPDFLSGNDQEDYIGKTSEALEKIINVVDILSSATQTRLKEFNNDKQEIIDEVKNASTSIEDNKNKIIETLAIFVGLFTFISLNFQLLKDITDLYISVGLILIAGGIILSFVLMIDLIIRSWRMEWESNYLQNEKTYRVFKYHTYLLVAFSLFFISVGVGVLFFKRPIESNSLESKEPSILNVDLINVEDVETIPTNSVESLME